MPAAGASARDGRAGAVGRERAGAASWSCSWPPSHSQVPSPVLADAVPVAARAILGFPGPPLHRVVLVLFGIMPIFSLWDLWDAYLSAALYSGNTLNASILVPSSVYQTLPAEAWRRATVAG